MFQGVRHHLIQRIGCRGRVDPVALVHQIFIDRTDPVAENVHLQLFGRSEAAAAAIGSGDSQSRLIGILINIITERVEPGGFLCAPKDFQVFLSVCEQMMAQIAVTAALFG